MLEIYAYIIQRALLIYKGYSVVGVTELWVDDFGCIRVVDISLPKNLMYGMPRPFNSVGRVVDF